MATNSTAPERVQAAFRNLSLSAVTLNEVSDELRKTISELEAALKKLNLGVPGWVTISESWDDNHQYYSDRAIGYTSIDHEWHLVLRKSSGNEWEGDTDSEQWAFNDAPRWMRIEGVAKIPDLLEHLVKQVEETAKKIKSKTTEAKTLTAAINAVASSADAQRK